MLKRFKWLACKRKACSPIWGRSWHHRSARGDDAARKAFKDTEGIRACRDFNFNLLRGTESIHVTDNTG